MNTEVIQAIYCYIKYGIIAISVACSLVMIVKHPLSLDHEEKHYTFELKILLRYCYLCQRLQRT